MFTLAAAALVLAAVLAWWFTRAPVVAATVVQPAPLVRTLLFSARVAAASRVELGSTLTGALGIADVFTRRDERRDVALRVEIDRRPVVETTAPIDRWVPFRAATTAGSRSR